MWKKEDTLFLIENYSNLGTLVCAEKLNKTKKSVSMKAHLLGLKLSKETKTKILKKSYNHKENFNKNLLNDINSDFAYILGILWADGFLSRTYNNIKISCLYEDIVEIQSIFERTGNWRFYLSKEKHWKLQKILSISDKNLHKFLKENDYVVKSSQSPSKILNKIPQNLQNIFFIGLIDGDGCFYYNKKLSMRQFSITSTYNQDWSDVEKMLNSIGVSNYKIVVRNHGKSKSSLIRITNKADLIKLYNYLYVNNNYGLSRKRKKLEEMIS